MKKRVKEGKREEEGRRKEESFVYILEKMQCDEIQVG